MPESVNPFFIGAVLCLAAMLQGLSGFGFSLLSVGILCRLAGPKAAVPLTATAAFVNSSFLAWLLRRSIDFKALAGLLILAVICVPWGALFLKHFDRSIVVRAIGLIVLAVSIASLLKAEKLSVFASKPYKWIAGVTSGLLGGAFNFPGPTLVLYAYNCDWPLRNAMANLQFLFVCIGSVTLASYFATGLLDVRTAGWGLSYAPLVMLFSFFGSRLSQKLTQKRLALVINVVLALLGLNLLIRG